MDGILYGTGMKQEVAGDVNKIPEFDPRSGNHFWMILIGYRCDPTKMKSGEQFIMDLENLVTTAGPFCFYCEEVYTKTLASRRCKGHGH